ncbi:Tn3 family transposase, partial [Pseudomonas savastanoi pv. savastanoi]
MRELAWGELTRPNDDIASMIAGLNKGEARNALARAVFFNRLGEIRDRSFEQQRYRASGLNLVTAAIVLWNTVYLERSANALRGH